MPPLEILVPLAIACLAFLAYVLNDLRQVEATRYLPKWGWALVSVLSIPTGGIVYLLIGRAQAHVVE